MGFRACPMGQVCQLPHLVPSSDPERKRQTTACEGEEGQVQEGACAHGWYLAQQRVHRGLLGTQLCSLRRRLTPRYRTGTEAERGKLSRSPFPLTIRNAARANLP